VFLWFYVVSQHFYQREMVVRLQVEDLPGESAPEGLVAANPVPTQARIRVSGKGKDLLKLRADNLVLRVPPPKGTPGSEFTIRLGPAQVEKRGTDADVQVVAVLEPKEVRILLDQRAERELPVEARVLAQPADSYTLVGEPRVQPARVRVSGPARQVTRLRAIPTDSLVLDGLHESVQRVLALHPPEGTNLELSSAQVTMEVEVQELAEYELAGIPVSVHRAGGRTVTPQPSRVRVKLRGGAGVLGSLDPEKDVDLYVDYQEWVSGGRGTVAVHAAPGRRFEVRQIDPARVALEGP
jgi:YbbR domain-containing protein